MPSADETLKNLQQFFDVKVKQHGATAEGVDWGSKEAQYKRFKQVVNVVPDKSKPFTVIDYGCGWGTLVNYMTEQGYQFTYVGYDMTPAVIEQAQETFKGYDHCTFTTSEAGLQPAEYVIGCGLFSMKLDTPEDEWQEHMRRTVNRLWELCTVAMTFNSLTSYSDPEYMRPELYYPDPTYWFDYCKRNLSRNVALMHDYNLYDFTMMVRR